MKDVAACGACRAASFNGDLSNRCAASTDAKLGQFKNKKSDVDRFVLFCFVFTFLFLLLTLPFVFVSVSCFVVQSGADWDKNLWR